MGIIANLRVKKMIKKINTGEVTKYSQIPDSLKSDSGILYALAAKLCGRRYYECVSNAIRVLAENGHIKYPDLPEDMKNDANVMWAMVESGEVTKFSQIPDSLKADRWILDTLAEKLCGEEYKRTTDAIFALVNKGYVKYSDLPKSIKDAADVRNLMVKFGKITECSQISGTLKADPSTVSALADVKQSNLDVALDKSVREAEINSSDATRGKIKNKFEIAESCVLNEDGGGIGL